MKLLLVLFVSCVLFAKEYESKDSYGFNHVDLQNYNGKYFSGKYLMYDCQDKHWVCGDKEAHDNCNAAIKRDLPNDAVKLPCFIVKKFRSLGECVHYNKKIVSNLGPTRKCYHPKYKERIILY